MRALLRSDRADDELAKALAKAGLYVERLDAKAPPDELEERLAAPDLAVVDPRLLLGCRGARAGRGASEEGQGAAGEAAEPPSLEAFCAARLGELLDRLGGETLPDLYETVVSEVERGIFQVALERAGSVGGAAELLGIHRNTLSRKLAQLGLRQAPARRRA